MWRRYRRLLRSDIAADVDEEIGFHLEMRSRDYEARGLSPTDAERAAHQRFGNVGHVAGWLRRHDQTKERARRAREFMSTFAQNLRVGTRALFKEPTFTAATVLTLALGIGATTAMFSVVYGVLLRPLPYGEPERLVRLMTVWKTDGGRGAASAANFRDWRAQNHVFEAMAYHTGGESRLLVNGVPTFGFIQIATPDFFRVFGVAPAAGRFWTEQENRASVAVVSHDWAVAHFGEAAKAIGSQISALGTLQIVGVAPSGCAEPPAMVLVMSCSKHRTYRPGLLCMIPPSAKMVVAVM